MILIPGYNDPIRITWNTDNNGAKVSVEMQPETHKVAQNRITLIQIPDTFYRVSITGMSEISDQHTVIGTNQYRVDYQTGIVMFHSSKEAQNVTVSKYWGRGIILTPATRIYTILDDNGNVLQTLHDLIALSQQAIQDFETIIETVNTADELNDQLLGTITNAGTAGNVLQAVINDSLAKRDLIQAAVDDSLVFLNNLQAVIDDSGVKRGLLQSTINDSTTKMNQLQSIINESITKLNQLQLTIGDSITKKNQLQAVIDDSITKLNNLQLVINDSVAKANALQSVINDSLVKKQGLQTTIDDGVNKDNLLKDTITLANERNDVLLTTIDSVYSAEGVVQARINDIELASAFTQRFISTGGSTFELQSSYKDYQYTEVFIQGMKIHQIEDFTLTTDTSVPTEPKYFLNIIGTIPSGTEVIVHVHQTLPVTKEGAYIIP